MRANPVAGPRMPHLFQPLGDAALRRVLARSPLLAFDFDGTLAPIVPTPQQARTSQSVAGKLGRIAQLLPTMIVTGRHVEDVQERIGFEPRYIVGNHGAEFAAQPAEALASQLDQARGCLQRWAGELSDAGVSIEDKGLSLALHYRLSRHPEQARELIRRVLEPAGPWCRTFGGKMVENVVPMDAGDKGTAVHRVVAESGVSCAVFVGDDVNDEPVFASAPPDWLTVRVGRDHASTQARFFLDSTSEVGLMLDRMLGYLLNG